MNLNDRRSYLLGGVLLGVGVGGVTGYLLGRHLVRTRAEEEIAEMREHFRARTEQVERDGALGAFTVLPTMVRVDRVVTGDGVRSDRAADEARPADTYGSVDPEDPEFGLSEEDYEDDAVESIGDDDGGDGFEDLQRQEANGSPDALSDAIGPRSSTPPGQRGPGPYVITEEQFSEECFDFQKLTVRYFNADKVLADNQDAVIKDIKWTVGEETLKQFEVNPNPDQPYIVYVRNEKIEVDFEICLDYGSYVEVVLGYGTANPKPRHVIPGGG